MAAFRGTLYDVSAPAHAALRIASAPHASQIRRDLHVMGTVSLRAIVERSFRGVVFRCRNMRRQMYYASQLGIPEARLGRRRAYLRKLEVASSCAIQLGRWRRRVGAFSDHTSPYVVR